MSEELKYEMLLKDLEKYPAGLDLEQVAEIMGVTRRFVDMLINDGKIPYYVLDENAVYKRKRVLKVVLIEYLLSKQTQN